MARRFRGKEVRRMKSLKDESERATRTDSHEIPDRDETSTIAGLPSAELFYPVT